MSEQSNTEKLPYLFTSKELDEETQLYYFGARYYDPRTSVWQSTDPALPACLSQGRVYFPISLAVSSYGEQNPLRYVDPTGQEIELSHSLRAPERQKMLGLLQSLTRDTLTLRGDRIVIAKLGSSGKDIGTQLVRNARWSKRVVTLAALESGVSHVDYADATAATHRKGSDSTIQLNLKDPVKTRVFKNRKTGETQEETIPKNIELGHELIHAERAQRGAARPMDENTKLSYKVGGAVITELTPHEETQTIGLTGNAWFTENKPRAEQHRRPRATHDETQVIPLEITP